MHSLYQKVLINKYLDNPSAKEDNLSLASSFMTSRELLSAFEKEKSKYSELINNPNRTEEVFLRILNYISRYNISGPKVKLSITESLIVKFNVISNFIDLETFMDDKEELEAALVIINSSIQEQIKEYGKFDDILNSMDQKLSKISQANLSKFDEDIPETYYALPA